MSLNWNVSEVTDHETVCFYDDEQEGAGGWQVRVSTDRLIWGTMSIGMNKITKENYREFAARMSLLNAARGWPPNQSEVLDSVKAHIGLWTNASSISVSEFGELLMEEALRNDHEEEQV